MLGHIVKGRPGHDLQFAAVHGRRNAEARKLSLLATDLARKEGREDAQALCETDSAVREALFGNVPVAKQRAGDAPDLSKRFPGDTFVQFVYLPVLRAVLVLNRGQPANAVEVLQTAVLLGARHLYTLYVRGLAHLAAHQGAEAAAEFERVLDHRGIALCDPIGALAHWQTGRAYPLAGEKTEARFAYQDFFTLWKDADRDIPFLLRSLRATAI